MRIVITESQLKHILGSTLRESENFANGVPKQLRAKFLKKVASEHPELDPAGFFYVGGSLKHNGKKSQKAAPREKISKPEGMSNAEYEQKLVIPNNKEYREQLARCEGEEFRPIVNGGRYFGGTADYGCDYEISNKGHLKVLNHGDVIKSKIYDPYPAPTRKAMQFHLNGFDNQGNAQKTCPNVAYMVANAFLGEHDPVNFLVIHKDGNWQNNDAENLEWVPRSKKMVAESQ